MDLGVFNVEIVLSQSFMYERWQEKKTDARVWETPPSD